MSSHREAPEISRDPVADSTDLYAFVSPDQADTVTLIANYIPLQEPSGGPNFYAFGEMHGVRYEIHVDNDGDGQPDVTYRFDFETRLRDTETFLYNTGPITELDSPTWNNRQFYSVTKVGDDGKATVLGCSSAAGAGRPDCTLFCGPAGQLLDRAHRHPLSAPETRPRT